VGYGVELHLGETSRVIRCASQLVALGGERLIERRAHLVKRASEVTTPARPFAQLPQLPPKVIDATVSVEPSPHDVPQGVTQAAALEQVPSALAEYGADVVRRREWIGAAGPWPVPESSAIARHAQAP